MPQSTSQIRLDYRTNIQESIRRNMDILEMPLPAPAVRRIVSALTHIKEAQRDLRSLSNMGGYFAPFVKLFEELDDFTKALTITAKKMDAR